MTTLVDRHDGELDGRLLNREARRPLEIELVLDAGSVDRHAVQHTAWMLANLLARLERRVVRRVSIVAPAGIPLLSNVVPGCTAGADFADALVSRLSTLNRSPVEHGSFLPDIRLLIAPGPSQTGVTRVLGEGWGGGLTRNTMDAQLTSATPIGPYVAAAIAAGEVFKQATLPEPKPIPESLFYSAWDFRASAHAPVPIDPSLEGVFLRSTLAGVGAVGSAFRARGLGVSCTPR